MSFVPTTFKVTNAFSVGLDGTQSIARSSNSDSTRDWTDGMQPSLPDAAAATKLFAFTPTDFRHYFKRSERADLYAVALSGAAGPIETIPHSLIGSITLAPTVIDAGILANLATTTSGSGTGALLNIRINGANTIITLESQTGGVGYLVGDVVTVAQADMPGADSDLEVTLRAFLSPTFNSLFDSITSAPTTITAGTATYTPISSGAGVGGQVELVTTTDTIVSLTPTVGGNFYVAGEVLTIAQGDMPGANADLVVTLVADDIVNDVVLGTSSYCGTTRSDAVHGAAPNTVTAAKVIPRGFVVPIGSAVKVYTATTGTPSWGGAGSAINVICQDLANPSTPAVNLGGPFATTSWTEGVCSAGTTTVAGFVGNGTALLVVSQVVPNSEFMRNDDGIVGVTVEIERI